MKYHWVFFLLLIVTVNSNAGSSSKPNPCKLRNDFGEACISQQGYRRVISTVINEYQPLFHSRGWNLIDDSIWESNDEYASYRWVEAKTFSLDIHGGLARAKEMNIDGLILVACHELGHFYGYVSGEGDQSLNGAEGEADYFAASQCASRVMAQFHEDNLVIIPQQVSQNCFQSDYMRPELCERINKAGLVVSQFRARVLRHKTPSFLTPDRTRVRKTSFDLTSSQCGLDTFYAGSFREPIPRCWHKR